MTSRPRNPGLGVADDPAVLDDAARDRADLGDLEDLADLGAALERLLDDRLEEADDGLLDVVGELVDDLVGPDLHALLPGQLEGLRVRLEIVADDDRLRGRGQEDVGLGDVPRRGMDDLDLDLLGAERRDVRLDLDRALTSA
jgi:hypothetical protein